MKHGILMVLICALIAACANEDITVTGISRECAIAIAEGSCSEYPQRYSYVERAAWLNGAHCWEVNLTDAQGQGKSYRINSQHKVINVRPVGTAPPVQVARTSPAQPYRVQTSPEQTYRPSYPTAPARDYSNREFYFRDGDYYERPRGPQQTPAAW
ncbi:MAG: hypothetical protein WCH43_10220 [Verrucomicrobiota bacterium]